MSETSTAPQRAPVKYLVKELSLIGNELYQAGATVEYDGLPAENLEPLCDEGRARYQEYLRSNEERVKKMVEQNRESAVGDPAAFGAALSSALAKMQEDQAATLAAAVGTAVAEAFARLFPNGAMGQLAVPAPAPAPGKAQAEPDSLV